MITERKHGIHVLHESVAVRANIVGHYFDSNDEDAKRQKKTYVSPRIQVFSPNPMSSATSAPVQSLEPADVGPRVNLGRSTRDSPSARPRERRGKGDVVDIQRRINVPVSATPIE